MRMCNRLTVKRAAALMGVSEQFVRMGLQLKEFDWGYAIKTSTKWTYYISPVKFAEATGICVEMEGRVEG